MPSAKVSRSTRERILDAAVALLHEQGYGGLTQPRVARASGITQGHLTYYFPRRSALLLAVAEHSLRTGMRQALNTHEGEPGPRAMIQLVRQALLEKQRTRTILGLAIASDGDREIKKPLRQMIVHAREIAATVLRQSDIASTAERATLLHACLVGLSVVTFAYDTPKSDREMGDAAESLLRLLARSWERAEVRGQIKPKGGRGSR
jgi:AcrR family transcriptional regulator